MTNNKCGICGEIMAKWVFKCNGCQPFRISSRFTDLNLDFNLEHCCYKCSMALADALVAARKQLVPGWESPHGDKKESTND